MAEREPPVYSFVGGGCGGVLGGNTQLPLLDIRAVCSEQLSFFEVCNLAHERFLLSSRLLLRSGLITPEIIQSLLPWVNSPTENHRVTSTAFLAQVRHRALKSSFTIRLLSAFLSGVVQFSS